MLNTHDFLRAVLPAKGRYSVAYKRPSGAFTHIYVDDLDSVEKHFSDYNGRANVYFTTGALHRNSETATKSDIASKRAFYIDLDVGEDKPYLTLQDAVTALRTFCDSFTPKLVKPIIVHSGNGLQAYWTIAEDVTESAWSSVARSLKALTHAKGLECDTTCTADSARVLRAPGTINLKGNNTAKVMYGGEGPKPFAYYETMFGAELATVPNTRLFDGVYINEAMRGLDETTKILTGYSGTKKFIKIISDTGCNIARDYLATKVCTASEPEWRAMLSLANVCEDREDAIIMVSEGHPGYVKDAAMRKAEATSGAYSCNTLRDIFGENGCTSCPHRNRISNPISLAIAQEIVSLEIPRQTGNTKVKDTVQVQLPYGYYFRGQGIFTRAQVKESETDEGGPQEIMIYPVPFYATNRYSDPVEGESVSFRLHRGLDGILEFILPMNKLVKRDTLQTCLAAYGVIAFDAGHLAVLHRYVGIFAQKLQAEQKAIEMHARCGWSEDNTEFVIGERAYTAQKEYSFPAAAGLKQLTKKMSLAGDFETWKEVLSLYEDKSLVAHRFALCAAIGAPVLKLVGECGATINFYSKRSGTGKTTLLRVINSVFGHPKDLMLSQNDTYAAKINRLGIMGSLPVTVDEVTSMTPEETSKFLYSITDGRERNRLSSKANVERTNNSQWMTQVITSSNAELAGKLELHNKSPEGEMARVIDVHAMLPKDAQPQAVDKVLSLIRDNYGWLGHHIASYIVKNRDSIETEINNFRDVITSKFNPSSNERFYFNTLISAYMGSVLTERLTGWKADRLELVQWFHERIKELRNNFGEIDRSISNSFNEFLNENRDRILVVNSVADSRSPATGGGMFVAQDKFIRDARQKVVARWEPDTRTLWIVRSEFNRWANERRINTRELLREMTETFPGSFINERKRISKGTSLDLGVVDSLVVRNADNVLEIDLDAGTSS